MFGIGLGELLLILLAIFLIAPKEIPNFLRKAGQFFRELEKLKAELFSLKEDLELDSADFRKAEVSDVGPADKNGVPVSKRAPRKKAPKPAYLKTQRTKIKKTGARSPKRRRA